MDMVDLAFWEFDSAAMPQSKIHYQLLETDSGKEFVMEWRNMGSYGTYLDTINLQVRFREYDLSVVFHFGKTIINQETWETMNLSGGLPYFTFQYYKNCYNPIQSPFLFLTKEPENPKVTNGNLGDYPLPDDVGLSKPPSKDLRWSFKLHENVSIEEPKNNGSNLIVYPNPIAVGAEINIGNRDFEEISFYGSYGQKVFSTKKPTKVTAPQKPGIYFIVAKKSGGVFTEQLVVIDH